MRVICTSGSVGAPGEPSPGATRPNSAQMTSARRCSLDQVQCTMT